MVSGPTLQQQLQQKVQEVKQVAGGLSEQQAQRRPAEGEWSAKEVLWHLTNRENALVMYECNRFLEEETPELSVQPGALTYGPEREKASVKELVSRLDGQYSELGKFLGGLNEEQLNRKARVPFLKDTPLGDTPTLGQWMFGIINFHLDDHLKQLQTLSK
jgi:hypothetical protein